jgi:hypothetical protein
MSEHHYETGPPGRTPDVSPWAIGGASVAVAGALFAIFVAYVTTYTTCDFYGCHRPVLYDVQLAVACIGLIPVGVLFWATSTRRKRAALIALVLAVVCYAAWGVLIDRAVHHTRVTASSSFEDNQSPGQPTLTEERGWAN